jgi:hypothetical protein
MRYYSASEFKTYIDCPYRWKKTFVDDRKVLGLDDDEYSNLLTNKYLDFGIYIHACIEQLNRNGGDVFAIAKSLLSKHKGITVDAFIRAKEVLANHSKRQYNMPDKLIHAEKKFEFVLDNGVPLRGTIDTIYKNKKDVVIVDYKTGYTQFNIDYVKSDLQMMIYTLFAQHEFPDHRISVILDNLNYDPIDYEFGEEELKLCKQYLEQKYIDITTAVKFEPRLNQFCAWCSQITNCPLVNKLSEMEIKPMKSFDKNNIGEAAKKYNKINQTIKVLDGEKSRYYEFLVNAAKINDGEWKDKETSIMLKNGKLYVKDSQ